MQAVQRSQAKPLIPCAAHPGQETMMPVTLPFHDRIDLHTGMFIGYATLVLACLMVSFGVRS